MSDKRGTKAAIAAEAWGALLDLTMRQRNRFFGILQEFGLSGGDLRPLLSLHPDCARARRPPVPRDQGPPRPRRALARAWACDASNVTWMADRRERRGLVERQMLG